MPKSCCFLGHSRIYDEIKVPLQNTIEKLITEEEVTHFYVGTQGGFDKLVYRVLCEIEEKHTVHIVVVLAYLKRTQQNPYYDSQKTIFPDALTKTPFRFAIHKRNSYMIENSNYVITYINTPFSRAYGNIEETVKKEKAHHQFRSIYHTNIEKPAPQNILRCGVYFITKLFSQFSLNKFHRGNH